MISFHSACSGLITPGSTISKNFLTSRIFPCLTTIHYLNRQYPLKPQSRRTSLMRGGKLPIRRLWTAALNRS